MDTLSDLLHRLALESGLVGPLLLGFAALCVFALIAWIALALAKGAKAAGGASWRGWNSTE